MNTQRDPDRLIHAFLMEGTTELADEVYVTVRDRIEHKRQRTVIGPWREPDVNRYLKIALAVAAVVVVAVGGYRQFGASNGAGPGASPTASPTTTAEPSGSGSAPALTETFASDRYGFTIKYPSGWVTKPATEPWTTGIPDFASSVGDVLYDSVREGDLWIAVASQPIGASNPDAWAAETIAFDDGCTATEPITVDGATGLVGTGDCSRSAVTTDGRGYFFWLYTSGDATSLDAYDRSWFEEVLATVQLQPGDAVDPAPSASAAALPDGPHVLLDGISTALPVTVTISAPGWFGPPGGQFIKKNDDPDPPEGAGLVVFADDLYVYGDPCKWANTEPDTPATTVDALVAGLSAQVSRDVSPPVDVSVGGYTGKAITLHVPDDAVFSDCDQEIFGSWRGTRDTGQTPSRYHQGPGQIDELSIVDVNGTLVVVDIGYYAGTPAGVVAELRAMAESVSFA